MACYTRTKQVHLHKHSSKYKNMHLYKEKCTLIVYFTNLSYCFYKVLLFLIISPLWSECKYTAAESDKGVRCPSPSFCAKNVVDFLHLWGPIFWKSSHKYYKTFQVYLVLWYLVLESFIKEQNNVFFASFWQWQSIGNKRHD